jgi:hypothetical protein
MLSALMTITAVAYAYLSDSMPGAYLTETDAAFIDAFQSVVWRCLTVRPIPKIISVGYRVRNVLLRRSAGRPIQRLERSQREAAVTRFILALSDQQLVVGIAIMVAAIANQCTLSVIEFRAAFALAWFSTTTHLATLDSLRHYFTTHPTIRNWRVLGMLIMMVMFLYSFVIILYLQNAPDLSLPVQCYLGKIDQPLAAPKFDDKGKIVLDESKMYTRFTNLGPEDMPPLTGIITFIYMVMGYKNRVLHLYGFRNSHFSNGQSVFVSRLHLQLLRITAKVPLEPNGSPKMSMTEWTLVLDDYAMERQAASRAQLLEKLSQSGTPTLRGLLLKWRLAYTMYAHSFLPVIPYLVFMLVYGLVQMIVTRWATWWTKSVDVDANMGFGQITPLLLTILPLLAAAEIYYGMSIQI